MTKEIKSISLVTENCEVFTLSGSDVIWVDYNSNDSILNPFFRERNELLGLCFKKNTTLLLDKSFISSNSIFNNRTDITIVEFLFDDGTIQEIVLTWPDGEENRYLTEHPGQNWFTTEYGNLMFQSEHTSDDNYTYIKECFYDLAGMDKK